MQAFAPARRLNRQVCTMRKGRRRKLMAKARSVRCLFVSDLIRTGEKQVWFLAEHLVDAPTVRAD